MSGMSKARERILKLADEGSFAEFGAEVVRRSTDFTRTSAEGAGDGVITGYATVNEIPVCIYSQDREVLSGSLGEMHAKKILALYDFALKMGLPVIGMLDSSGIRLEEVTDALESFGALYAVKAKASGTILQIDLVFGMTGGGMAVSTGLSDFTLMEKGAELFVNAPNTLDRNFKEKCDTASADFQAKECGTVDFAGTEDELFDYTRELLSVLPMSCQDIPVKPSDADLNRMTPELTGVTDVRTIAAVLSDGETFLETKKDFAPSLVTGFILLDGMTTAVIGNAGKKLTSGGLRKAAAFVRFADAFGIPVLTLTNTSGFEATTASEKEMLRASAEYVSALASATVPKLNVILEEAFGSAYVLMNSKAVGADIVYAVRGSRIGAMDASSAAKIIGGEDLSAAAALFDEKQTALSAAKRGYVDEIIEMTSLRKKVLLAFEILSGKREKPIERKHSGK